MEKVINKDATAEVTKEPELFSDKGKLKPDLVIKNRAGVFVVDVTVRHDGEYLNNAKKDKERKYGVLQPAMQRKRLAPSAEVMPIVVGTTAAMPVDTIKCLEK
jgi:hypothetical protein